MPDPQPLLVRRHLVIGWWSLVLFLGLGTVLEVLHGFKHPMLLDVSNEMRRMMWRLAHAHGALLGILHIAWAASLYMVPGLPRARLTSRCLTAASILLPGGFFLGGIVVYGSDPWPGVVLAPIGAGLAILAVFLAALGVGKRSPTEE